MKGPHPDLPRRDLHVASLMARRHAPQEGRNRALLLDETAAALRTVKDLKLDLVVLCEAVEAYGQTVDQAEETAHPGPFLSLYAGFAAAEKCAVAGSVKIRDGSRVYNAMVLFGPEGNLLGIYAKNYLIRSELEEGLSPGPGPAVIDTPFGRIGGVICFDLNFEPLLAQYAALRPDILVFPSMYHGGLMQSVWAYRCRSFFISALPFLGGGILDPFGRTVAATDCYNPAARARINLDRVMVHLDFNRDRFPEIERKYGRDITIDVPPNIGSALLYSRHPKYSAAEIAVEFGLELLDDYFRKELAKKEDSI